MQSIEVSPCHLKLTDPLLALENRRNLILERILDGSIPPIYIIGESNDTYLLFNGNKRTTLAKERGLTLRAKLIENEKDLAEAQKEDPRKFPEQHLLEYNPTKEYLKRRAEQFAKMSWKICQGIGCKNQPNCPIRELYGY